jgi:hypothetical protein
MNVFYFIGCFSVYMKLTINNIDITHRKYFPINFMIPGLNLRAGTQDADAPALRDPCGWGQKSAATSR